MDFELSEEQRMIRDMCRQFATEVIAPRAEEINKPDNNYACDTITDILNRMAALSMMGIPFPEEYGGTGGDWVTMVSCVEEIARADAGLAQILDVSASCAHEIGAFGTEEQKQKWLPPLVKGETIAAFALTEDEAGSDAAAIKTKATLDNDEWVINGSKQFVSNIALDKRSIAIVVAVSGKNDKGRNIINDFIVPKSTPGFIIGNSYSKIGLHSQPTNEVTFEDCRIPRDYLLGREGHGLAQRLATIQTARICVAACSVGIAQACLDASLSYAKQRRQFGRPIIDFQGVSFKLGDMAVGIQLARLMYLKAAWLKDNKLPYNLESSVAKLYASEMAEKTARDAVQIHGGYGYILEYPVARYYTQARLVTIGEGTSEIQRLIISRAVRA
jgi:alkylation response protein AidB-like acyl-CoA dehydrogenase